MPTPETIPPLDSPLPESSLPRMVLLVMAFSAGASVANLYYNQPLLEQMRHTFAADPQAIGWIPTLTQAGYAAGMLFLVPLGDRFEKKRLVLLFTFLASLCALLIALSPQLPVLALGSFFLGLSTMTPQLLVPFAAQMAPTHERGQVAGTMLSGILMGILLARTVSGFVGAAYGWRVLFALVAGLLLILGVVMAKLLPKSEPTYHGHYFGLLKSVWDLFRSQPVLQEACWFGAMFFGAFSVFWATLIYLMQTPPFHFDARAVGIYGLVGVVGALLSPMFGKLSDRGDARCNTGLMLMLTLASFIVYYLFEHNLIGLGIGVLLMDIGVQAGHISNQTRIFKLVPHAQSRIQTAYMFCFFVGAACGSFVGSWSWNHFHWPGVCASAIAFIGLALLRYFWPQRVTTT
jgi:predicted MFS family arabinose efflux permease